MAASLDNRVRRLHLSVRRAVDEWLGGAYRSVYKGVGIAFEEVREYQPGDDVRTIEWNVTARTGTPHVKRFIEERELTVMLAVDVGPTLAFGSGDRTKRDVAVESAAAIAHAALSSGDRVGLALFGQHVVRLIPPRKGARHTLRLIRELLDAPTTSAPTDRSTAIARLLRVLHRRSLLVLASDFISGEAERAVRLASLRHDVVGIVPFDPWERELPDVGRLCVRDSNGGILEIETDRAEVRAQYRENAQFKTASLRRSLRRADVDWVEIATTEDPIDPLRRLFDRRR